MDDQDRGFRSLLDSLQDGVYFVDRDRRVTFWNRAAARITGYGADEIVGTACGEDSLCHVDEEGRNLCRAHCPLSDALGDGGTHEADLYLRHKDGHRVPVHVSVAPVRDPLGRTTGAVETFRPRGAMASASDLVDVLQQVALLDPLTGLGTRRYAEMQLSGRLDELRRYGWGCGVLFIDIDDFKAVNDAYGHETGDRVLQMVSRSLLSSLRSSDFLGRWGGEEFVGVIANVGADDLRAVAERCRFLVEESGLRQDSDYIRVTVSIGATLARPQDAAADVVERADGLMYEAKRAGKNAVVLAGAD